MTLVQIFHTVKLFDLSAGISITNAEIRRNAEFFRRS